MTSNPSHGRPKIAACVAAALMATTPTATPRAGESDASAIMSSASDRAVKNLQLGVGKSVIVDLPEEAGEIYVGDPKIANAIVRSAKRIYVSGVANGQTSIFALAKDGRKIETIEVSVGHDVGELSVLLNTAIPGNDVHVRTVGDKIILTGSVASAEEAQKAIDIASGFIDDADGASSDRRRRRLNFPWLQWKRIKRRKWERPQRLAVEKSSTLSPSASSTK